MLAHLRPVGNPPPPRPRSPDAVINSIVARGPRRCAVSTPTPPASVARYASSEVIGLVGSRKVGMSLLGRSTGTEGSDPTGAPCAVEHPHRGRDGGGLRWQRDCHA